MSQRRIKNKKGKSHVSFKKEQMIEYIRYNIFDSGKPVFNLDGKLLTSLSDKQAYFDEICPLKEGY